MPEKPVIYYDEKARDKEAERRRYEASKLKYAAEKELERFNRVTWLDKAIDAIINLVKSKSKRTVQAQQKER